MRAVAIQSIGTLLCLLVTADACARAVLAVSTDAGAAAEARLYDGQTYAAPVDVSPFGTFTGGARLACGDVNADGQADLIVAAGPDGSPTIRIINGRNGALIDDFLAFPANFTNGMYAAAGDVDGDGRADVIAGAGSGANPAVKVFSGADRSLIRSFFAFAPSFTGGVRVAAGDVNGDGHADIIVGAGPGAKPEVRIFDGVTLAMIDDFSAFSDSFLGGVYVASADLNGDGVADIIVGADAGGTPTVAVFSGVNHAPLESFYAFDVGFSGGVRVGAGDVNGDGKNEIIVAAGNGGGEVKVLTWPSLTIAHDFLPFGANFSDGIFVAGPAPDDTIFADGLDP